MKKLLILLTVCLLFTNPYIHAQSWQWARQNSGGYMGYAYYPDPDIKTDASGNVYMVGSYITSTITFGSYTIINPGGFESIYLVKYDSSGNVLWLKGIGGTGISYVEPSSIAIDATGNIYLTGGSQDSTITFDTITLHNTPNMIGMFLVKYNSDGHAIWAKHQGGNNAGVGWSVAVDINGDILATGETSDTSVFGSITIISTLPTNSFVVKYNTAGNVIWAKVFGGISIPYVNSLATDDSGNTIIVGYTQSDLLQFGTITLLLPGSTACNHLFYAKYDSVGNLLWAKKALGDDNQFLWSVITDNTGSIYFLGRSDGTSITFDSTIISNPKWFFVKLNNSGQIVWYKKSNYYGPSVLTKDADNNIYLAGYYLDIFTIDSDTLLTGPGANVVLIKTDSSGSISWLKKGGGDNSTRTWSVAASIYGNIYIAGYYNGPNTIFGSNILINPDSFENNIFLVKLDTTYSLYENNINIKQGHLLIYPNPTNGIFTIDIPSFKNSTNIAIFDINGKIVVNRNLNTNKNQEFNLSQNPCGIYVVVVNVDGLVYSEKVILK